MSDESNRKERNFGNQAGRRQYFTRSAVSERWSDVSFDVREHEIRAIIGPNGAGKSSMLNVINGVYHPQREER